MIGKLLKERYHIVQVLSAGACGRIYIAEDIHNADNPKCVIKHIKSPSRDPKYLRIARRKFATEAEALKKLGHHQQIPQLYASFEEDQEFYLVQEFIQGHPLSAELPISCGERALYLDTCTNPTVNGHGLLLPVHCWTEDRCTELLREVLLILEFVHSQGFIHCDIKPNNIIRRFSDGKLFLIDFGAVQLVRNEFGTGLAFTHQRLPESVSKPLSPNSISHISSTGGYIPIEQLRGYPCPNSDIYALGLITIQALTGLDPALLKVDPDTGKVIWQHQEQISKGLATVLNQIVQYDFKNRYQSASEALQALSCSLSPTLTNSQESGIVRHYLSRIRIEMPNLPIKASEVSTQVKFILYLLSLFIPRSSPLRNIIAVGIAANTLVILFGVFSLLYAFGLEPEPDLLGEAQAQFQSGDLEKAIATAKSIPANNPAYPEAQAVIKEWRRTWNVASAKFQAIEQAFNEERWLDVLEEEHKLPAIYFWRQKTEPFVQQAQSQIEAEAQQLLKKAYERASVKDFTNALQLLKQIPPGTSISKKVEQKLVEYNKKQEIKADYLLEQAYKRADVQDYKAALSFIKQIPQRTSAYEKAQPHIAEYTEQQHLKEEVDEQEKPTHSPSPQARNSSRNRNAIGNFQDLNPGNRLVEITLKESAKI